MESKPIWTLALAAAFGAGLLTTTPALAQDGEVPPPPASEGNDPGNWRPSEATPPPVLGPAPAGGNGAPAPAPSDPNAAPAPSGADGTGEMTEEQKAERERKIRQNMNDTQGILEGILNDKSSEFTTLKKRLANVEKLLKKYENVRVTAEDRRRRMQVELFNKSLFYQRQAEAGKIPKDLYEKRLAEANETYQADRADLDREIKFAAQEEARLKPIEQDLLNRIQIYKAEHPQVVKPPKSAQPSVAEQLAKQVDAKIRALSNFRVKASLGNEHINARP